MYKVIMDGNIIHDPSYSQTSLYERIILDGVVSKQVNHADSFKFTIYPNNWQYANLHLITSRITVLKDDTIIFHGRPLTEETGWENEKKITCEGDLALLNDTILRPYSFKGSVADYVRYLVNSHNEQVGTEKQITVRHVTVTDPNNLIVRSNSDYVSVMQEIMDKTVESGLGGYLQTEYDAANDVIYLDYLVDSINGTNQTLEIGKNILDFQRSISSEALATALIPLGAADQDTGERLTIKSVNEGRDYIANQAVGEYGLIYATYTWDDVTLPLNLLRKANDLLNDMTRIVPRIQLSAIDLTEAGVQVDAIGFFEYVTVVDTEHNVSGQYLITERTYHISAPENDTVTFGGEDRTISGQSARTSGELNILGDTIINKAIDIIEYQTNLLKGGAGGYMVTGTDAGGHPNELFFMDTDSVETARSILRLNKNGIGFSTTGIDGPYTNAWTIDGNLNASFITTGILKDRQNKNYWDLNTGELHVESMSIIAEKLDNIGGRNLLLQSATKHLRQTGSPTMTYEDNIAVSEWGCDYGIRYYGSKGSSATFGTLGGVSATPATSITGQKYVHSVYIKNNDSVALTVENNGLGDSVSVDPGESTRVVLYGTGNGSNNLGFTFRTASTFDFVMWHPQIEYGEVVTSWNPAPEDAEGAIEENTAQIAINTTNIQSKVSQSDYNGNTIASLINQTATTIQIRADKIDLQGYVTFSNLSTSGQTNINGANITTGLIKDTQNKNSWNLTTGAFVITDGTINITTASGDDDVIKLVYGTSLLHMSPYWLELSDTNGVYGNYRMILRQDMGAITVSEIGDSSPYFSIVGHTGVLGLRGKTTPGVIDLKDASNVTKVSISAGNGFGTLKETGIILSDNGTRKRAALTYEGLVFRNANDVETAKYLAAGFERVVTIADNYTIGSGGYVSWTKPTGYGNRKLISADVYRYTSATGAFNVLTYNGNTSYGYIVGTPGVVINGLEIECIYN